MPSIEDYIEEAKYNLGRTISDVERAMSLEEDATLGDELSERYWRLECFLDQLKEARNAPLHAK